MHLLQIGVHIIIINYNNLMHNLDKIWISKHNNGITMLLKKLIEDGEMIMITNI